MLVEQRVVGLGTEAAAADGDDLFHANVLTQATEKSLAKSQRRQGNLCDLAPLREIPLRAIR
jgi:hypothetical protein